MTTSADIRLLFVAALKGATDAGQAVYSPYDWPTSPDAYPLIILPAELDEDKQSLGPSTPQFDTISTIYVIARTKSPAKVGDAGAADAFVAAERLKAQIEAALINNPLIWADPAGGQRIEQFTRIRSKITGNSEGSMPMAELAMSIEVKFYQGPELFFPIPTNPLQTLAINADMAQPFDANGTYSNPPFPSAVNPAPRTSGPDGRNEGALNITLPQ